VSRDVVWTLGSYAIGYAAIVIGVLVYDRKLPVMERFRRRRFELVMTAVTLIALGLWKVLGS
jgi:hypothetical protein